VVVCGGSFCGFLFSSIPQAKPSPFSPTLTKCPVLSVQSHGIPPPFFPIWVGLDGLFLPPSCDRAPPSYFWGSLRIRFYTPSSFFFLDALGEAGFFFSWARLLALPQDLDRLTFFFIFVGPCSSLILPLLLPFPPL